MTLPPRPSERLPLDLKLAFGAPTFAGAAMAIPIAVHMTKFYADVVLVPLGTLGLAIALARAFDAVTDPLIGWLSDRTRSRWGRRRPYLAVGAPLCALSFWLLFSPPASLSPGAATVWFGATFALYYLFHTIYLVPHQALGPELTLDYHERSSMYAVREAFLVSGTLCAALLPGVLGGWLGDERAGLSLFAAIFGLLLTGLYAWLVLRARERREFAARPTNPLVPGIRRCLRNRPFRVLLATSILSHVPGVVSGAMIPFYNAYVLRPDDPGRWLTILLAGYFGAAFASLPLWLRFARRAGKKPAWLASFAVLASGPGALLFLGEGDMLPALLALAWTGAGFGATTFLTLAIKADVIDYDELVTGRRREGQFTSFWSLIPKLVVIPGAALPVALLGSLGYVPNETQTPAVHLAIRALTSLTPALFAAAALVAGARLPIDERVHREIRSAIAARARGEPVVDPVTGAALAPPSDAPVPDEVAWQLDHFSPGELRRLLAGGPGVLTGRVVIACAASLAVGAATAGGVLARVSAAGSEPGVLAVGGVVAAGFAFCLAVFHALRLAPARRLARAPLPPAWIRAHVGALAPGAPDGGGDLADPRDPLRNPG